MKRLYQDPLKDLRVDHYFRVEPEGIVSKTGKRKIRGTDNYVYEEDKMMAALVKLFCRLLGTAVVLPRVLTNHHNTPRKNRRLQFNHNVRELRRVLRKQGYSPSLARCKAKVREYQDREPTPAA